MSVPEYFMGMKDDISKLIPGSEVYTKYLKSKSSLYPLNDIKSADFI